MTTNMCETECPICMEIIDLCKNCSTTECGHQFHSNCLIKNIAFNGFECPYCRFEMFDEVYEDSEDEDAEDAEDADDEEDAEDAEDEDDDEDDDDYEDPDDSGNNQDPLPSFELIKKKFIEKEITYDSLVKTILYNSMIYHKNENFEDYKKNNSFVEEIYYEMITNYQPEQEQELVTSNNIEFNFYFLQDEYSQRRYQREMENDFEKFLDSSHDYEDDADIRDILDNVRYLNNRFMVVV